MSYDFNDPSLDFENDGIEELYFKLEKDSFNTHKVLLPKDT